MSKEVNKNDNAIKVQLRSLRPCLERLAKIRYVGKSLRLPFYDMQFGSPMELAIVTTYAHTLEMRSVSMMLGIDKDAAHNAITRFRANNDIASLARLLRFLAKDTIREELVTMCMNIAYPHEQTEGKNER